MTSPRKDCQNRAQGCHSICSRYKLFHIFQQQISRRIKEKRRLRGRLTTIAQERIKIKKIKNKSIHQYSRK